VTTPHSLEGESIESVEDLGLGSRDCIRQAQHGDQVTCCSEHDSARTGCVKMRVNVARTERLGWLCKKASNVWT